MSRRSLLLAAVVVLGLAAAPLAHATPGDPMTHGLGQGLDGSRPRNGTYLGAQTADGRFVVYADWGQVHLYDSLLGQDRQVSGGPEDDASGEVPRPLGVSDDGSSVSWARGPYFYVTDMRTGTSRRTSLYEIDLTQTAVGQVSGDGTRVLLYDQRDGTDFRHPWDLYLLDLTDGAAQRIDVEADGVTPAQGLFRAELTADGTSVVFLTDDPAVAGGLAEGETGLFRFDVATGQTTPLDRWPSADWPVLMGASRHGEVVVVSLGFGARLVAVRPTGTTPVSLDPAGAELLPARVWAQVSDDGRYVTFPAQVPGHETAADTDVYRRDLLAGTTAVLPVDGVLDNLMVSGDGSTAAMVTAETAGGDTADARETLRVASFGGAPTVVCCSDGQQHQFWRLLVDRTGDHVAYEDVTRQGNVGRTDAYQWRNALAPLAPLLRRSGSTGLATGAR